MRKVILEVTEKRVILAVEENKVILEGVVWEWIILKQFSFENYYKYGRELSISHLENGNSRLN